MVIAIVMVIARWCHAIHARYLRWRLGRRLGIDLSGIERRAEAARWRELRRWGAARDARAAPEAGAEAYWEVKNRAAAAIRARRLR